MMHRSLVLILAILLSTAGLALPTRSVESEASRLYAAPSKTGNGDCESWQNACTLQTALTGASAGDEIWVAAGTHKPGSNRTDTFQLKSGVAVYGGFAGNEGSLDERDFVLNETILSGDIGTQNDASDNAYHVVTSSGTDDTTVLDGFTITAGNANGAIPDNYGGGMHNQSGSPTLVNVVFSQNSAYDGGGMHNQNSSPTLTNVTFSNNTANNCGGGIHSSSSPLTLTDVSFSGNEATVFGGGLFAGGNIVTLTGVSFTNNSAQSGGGMCGTNNEWVSLTNVTFHGNSAAEGGGGFFHMFIKNTALANTTFSENSAEQGGGIFMVPRMLDPITITIHNSIFWGNTDSTSAGNDHIFGQSTIAVSLSDNVIQGGCPDPFQCTHTIAADPLLGSLGHWGGFSPTIPLLPGSAAIDAGSTTCPTTDQRGAARSDGHCDIGAYESRGFTLLKTGGDDQDSFLTTPFAQPLSVAVTSPFGEPVNGGIVSFRAPVFGASTIPAAADVVITGGAAVRALSPNGNRGTVEVLASAAGAAPVAFELNNITMDTITEITSSSNPAFTGRPVTFTITVSAPPGAGVPAGKVMIVKVDPDGIGQSPLSAFEDLTLNDEGVAEITIPSLPPGKHDFLARYLYDHYFTESISEIFTQIVDPLTVFIPLIAARR